MPEPTLDSSATPELKEVDALGVLDSRSLPDPEFLALWDAIFVEPSIKDRLLAHAILNFTVRTRVDRSTLPLHGLLLLIGPAGTGKTSLARGLAAKTAAALPQMGRFTYLEVDPHDLVGSSLGKSQQAVQALLSGTVAEQAAQAPTIVLLDEVETLAAARSKVSFELNPVDVHRATDALLAQLDHLAARLPNLLFVATSNFSEAIDTAFISRADFAVTVPRPAPDVCRQIFLNTVESLAEHFPRVREVLDDPEIKEAASLCRELDGRQIRKVVVSACTLRYEAALDPNKVTASDFLNAVRRANLERRRRQDED